MPTEVAVSKVVDAPVGFNLILCARNGETRSSREVEGNPGAIELSGSNLVLVEMKRLGWSIEQGQEDWQWRDKKRSRNQ